MRPNLPLPLWLLALLVGCMGLAGCQCASPSNRLVCYTETPGFFTRVELYDIPLVQLVDTDTPRRVIQDTICFIDTLNPYFVHIVVDDNLTDFVEVRMEGTRLIIENFRCIDGNPTIKVFLGAPNLSSIRLDGDTRVDIDSVYTADSLQVQVVGTSEFNGEIQTQYFETFTSGNGVIRPTGKTTYYKGTAWGASVVQGFDLVVDTVQDLSTFETSQVNLFVNDQLVARGYDNSIIRYRGNPTTIERSLAGNAQIVQRRD